MNHSPFAFPLLAQDVAPPAADVAPPAADVQAAAPAADGTATTAADPNPPGGVGHGQPQRPPSLFDGPFMFLLIGMMLLMVFFSFNANRKEKRRKQEMLASLAKGAKVHTVGGVIGTIVEVRDNEVIVKVDENSNTRMRFLKSAVNAVTAEK